MRWWMVLLLIAGILIFLLSMSVSFHFRYWEKNFQVKLCVFGLRFPLYSSQKEEHPQKTAAAPAKKGQAVKKKKGKSAKQEQDKQKSQPRGIKETIFLVVDILKSLVNPTRFMLRHVRITAVDATVIAGGEDAAQTAILYGQLCAAVYGGASVLKNLLALKVKNLTVGYDFNRKEPEVTFFCKVKLRGFVVIIALARMIFNLLVNTSKRAAADRLVNTEPAKV